MKISFPILPILIEINVRKRTEPFQFRVRTLIVVVASAAFIAYLLLPLSDADKKLMAAYEQLGNNDPKPGLTKADVIRMIGPPSTCDPPTTPKTCTGYTWIAQFDRSTCHDQYTLRLSIDTDTDLVAAWGLNKTKYEGLDFISFRVGQAVGRLGL